MQTLEEITTYEAFFARSSYKISGDGEPDRVMGVMVPANFFPFLGTRPVLGRTFTEEECRLNGPGAVILSYGFWERRYSADPGVIGRQIGVNDRAATIIGIMPRSFDFGAVFAPGNRIEIYMPAVFDVVRDWGNTMAIVGRLKSDATLAAAQLEANAIIERQQRERPEFGPTRSYGAILKPFHETVIATMRRPMMTIWAAVGLVLLIVCVNLSNLLLARAASRRTEMALRGALGAGRWRLARQLLTESFVLSFIGGSLGAAFAYAAVWYVRSLERLSIPLLKNVGINGSALAVAAGVTIITALLFGLAPAIATVRRDLGEDLKSGGRGMSDSRLHGGMRGVLVVSEIALACMLLVGAGLLIRSFRNVLDINLGFQTGGTYALRVDAGRDEDSAEKFRAYMERLIAAARNVPGVASASISDALPFDSNRSWYVRVKGDPPDNGTGALIKIVGPGLHGTMQTPLIAGREFTEHDKASSGRVVMINQTLARRLWPDRDPLLGTLQTAGRDWQVVGVVADVRHLSVEEPSGPEFYLPLLQMSTMSPSLVVRTDRPFEDVAPALRAALSQVAPGLPTNGFRPLRMIVDRALSPRLFFVNLLTAFAGAALVLAAIGIYGVISYNVTRRTSEIGVRMALGASGQRIRSAIVGETLKLALAGVTIGLLGSVALSSLLDSLLYGVSSNDPWTLVGTVAILLGVALAAGLFPALRASRISPLNALRAD
jgi:predicted permease